LVYNNRGERGRVKMGKDDRNVSRSVLSGNGATRGKRFEEAFAFREKSG